MIFYRLAIITLLLTLAGNTVFAQTYNLTGRITDETDMSGLPGVSLYAAPLTDTSKKTGTVTDVDGAFTIANLPAGQYLLKASYVGFSTYQKQFYIVDQDVNLGTFNLKVSPTTLQNVIVQGQATRAEQLGDTVQINANSYKVNPDANAEDLISKMPGVTTENNTLKVNGEDVKQILVDGKPFFGDDPNAAVKNLPAEVIDKIQVFDKLSEQSQFSGFDDGQSSKTINIVTKPGKNNGQFGKIFAGGGLDAAQGNNTNLPGSGGAVASASARYAAGGNVNFFNGNRRISVIGLSNNINQQNFSTEDLMGVVGTSSGRGGGGGGARDGGRRGGGASRGGSSRGGGADASDFLVGQQGGITQTHALGINYSDNWGKKIEVSGSYFFNHTENNNNSILRREYFTDEGLIYDESSLTTATNQNHRFNLRLEYNIDSSNSLVLTPRLSVQNNDNRRNLTGAGYLGNNTIDSRTVNTNTGMNTGLRLSNNLLYRHKFAKRGRTLSLNLGIQMNNRDGNGTLYSLNEYIMSDTTLLDQVYDLQSDGYTLSSSLNYTEPISEKSQLMFNYAPSFNKNNSDKETFDMNGADGQYDILNPLLSNAFDNTYTTHEGGISYRYRQEKMNAMLSLDGQYALLEGDRTYPVAGHVEKTFSKLLPRAMFNYRFSRTKNLRVMYRTRTNAPSISQLQDVVDNTNPLILKSGNPDLRQDYTHTFTTRYGATNATTAHSFFALLYANYVNDYIANATYIPTKDSVISISDGGNDVLVNRGSQLIRPVNLDGNFSARTFFTYGLPVKSLKSNLNLNAGLSYGKSPSMINTDINYSNNYTVSAGLTLGSNISENIDFTLNYSGNYTTVRNTLQTTADNVYYSQNTSFKFNWIFLDNFVFNTNLNHTLYTGLSQSFNQSFLLWNAAFGYKFLKDRSLDIRLSAFDILNQNRSISREITDTYLEDSYTNVLQRYFMLTATYSLRNFKGKNSDED